MSDPLITLHHLSATSEAFTWKVQVGDQPAYEVTLPHDQTLRRHLGHFLDRRASKFDYEYFGIRLLRLGDGQVPHVFTSAASPDQAIIWYNGDQHVTLTAGEILGAAQMSYATLQMTH